MDEKSKQETSMEKSSQYAETPSNPEKGQKADDKYRYGWFGFTPDWLQWANTAWVYCIFMMILHTFSSGTTNGLAGVIQSSIERRFQFSSTQLSWIIIAYEIFSLPVSLFVTWLGIVGCHRPRWVAGAILASATGCFVYAMPHLVSDPYVPGGIIDDNEEFLCSNRTGVDVCKGREETEGYAIYMVLFLLARLFLSFGGSGMHTLGITFMDDCCTKAKFSLYSSLFALGGIVGPAIGFVGGAMFLEVYTEWPNEDRDDVGIEPGDPRWVGAWWLPFMLFGCCLFLVFIPLSGYPADLPGAAEVRANKKSEAFNAKSDEKPEDPTKTGIVWKDIWPYTKDIAKNWTFILLSLYVCCDMSIISAFTAFGPKYVEVKFNLTGSQAGVLFGLLVIPSGLLGTIGSGVIIDRFKLSLKQIMQLEFGLSIMVIFAGLCFLIGCPQVDFAGVNRPYSELTSDLNITDTCNVDCMCEDLPFRPVCSHDNVQYFSPCHAGCLDRVQDDEEGWQIYNCSCISSPGNDSDSQGSWSICSNPDCSEIALFSVLMFFAMFGLFMSEAMNISAVIRSVKNKQRIYATFLSGFVIRFVGNTPGPLILAACFDASCILWQENCGSRGSCFYYDTEKLGKLVLAYGFAAKFGSILAIFFAFWLYKPPPEEVEEMDVVCDKDIDNDMSEDDKKTKDLENVYENNIFDKETEVTAL